MVRTINTYYNDTVNTRGQTGDGGVLGSGSDFHLSGKVSFLFSCSFPLPPSGKVTVVYVGNRGLLSVISLQVPVNVI